MLDTFHPKGIDGPGLGAAFRLYFMSGWDFIGHHSHAVCPADVFDGGSLRFAAARAGETQGQVRGRSRKWNMLVRVGILLNQPLVGFEMESGTQTNVGCWLKWIFWI